ncbi:MAG: lysophospholipid acyltransferase family protein, partial [Planctomycetaceae bacterium]
MSSADLPSPHRRNALWLFYQFTLQVVFQFWLGYRARGLQNVPPSGGGLILANHQSFLDPLLIGLPLRRPISYVARDSLFRVPVIGWILRNTYVMPINRSAASPAMLRDAIRRIEHGFLVGVFPEGTRTHNGDVGTFKPGFISLIRRARTTVYPVGIAGAHLALPRHAWFLKPKRVHVVFGEPLTYAELEPFLEKGNEQQLLEFIRERVCACQHEAEAWREG